MAIKIPSKNIYDIQNPKIRDNVIDTVSVNQTISKEKKEYNTNVFNGKGIGQVTVDKNNDKKEDVKIRAVYFDTSAMFLVGYAYLDNPAVYENGYAYIPKLSNNTYISKIHTEDDENNKISISLRGKKITKDTKRTITWQKTGDNVNPSINYNTTNIEYSNEKIEEGVVIDFPDMPIRVNSPELVGYDTNAVVVGLNNETKIPTRITETDDYYTVSYQILRKLTINKLVGSGLGSDYANGGDFEATGKYEEYYAEKLNITINGNTIGLDLQNGEISYGSGNKPTSLSGNELLQDSGIVYLGQSNIKSISEHLANNVLTEYQKGKETATLLCDISDYYNENGEKVIDISSNAMSFRLHDEVIPYVFGANGQDQPMSKYQDGTAKVFEVVGSNIIYDGAVWQELTLLEKKQ